MGNQILLTFCIPEKLENQTKICIFSSGTNNIAKNMYESRDSTCLIILQHGFKENNIC